METWLEDIRIFLEQGVTPAALVLLGAAAMIEYLFPPFPGDAIVLLGAFVVARYHWSPWPVLAAVLAGSGTGSMANFYLGRWLGRRQKLWARLGPRVQGSVDRLLVAFRRHGEGYVALNRFLPGVRSIIFIAAGLAGLRAGRVFAFAMLSAALWNGVIFTIGLTVGASWERLFEMAQVYSSAAWLVLGVLAVALLIRTLWKRHRADLEKPH